MGSKRKRAAQESSAAPPAAKKKQKTTSKTIERTNATPPDTAPFVDNPKGEAHKRESGLYELLSSEDPQERFSASISIVSGLLEGEGVQESTLQRHLERNLFRGLASGRKGARLGRASVLTEIICQLLGPKALTEKKYHGMTFDRLLSFLIAKTKPDGDLSGQEEKDHFLGLLFGLDSFVKAKVIFDDDERWHNILDKLLKLGEKKPWIREECGWIIASALPDMKQSQAEYTLEKLLEAEMALSPEGVAIWLMARSKFPDMRFPSKPWGQSGNPLEHLKSLGKALKESSSPDDTPKAQQAKQTGNWNPKLHFVWNELLNHYISALSSKTHGIKTEFENFWKVTVDENLFSATASTERKYWGFLLFEKVIENAPAFAKVLPSVFSQNLVRCIINHVKIQDRYLHRIAERALKRVIQAVTAEAKLLPIILPCLISGHGTYSFDRVTRTKTIDQLLRMVDNGNATKVIKSLVDPTLLVQGDASDVIKEAESRRQFLADNLSNLVRSSIGNESKNGDWIQTEAIPTLAQFAYGQREDCQPLVSTKTQDLFRTRLMSAFGHLLSDIQGYSYPCDLLQTIPTDAIAMDEEIAEARDQGISTMRKILKKIKKDKAQNKAPLQALALLYSLVVFQLYNGESEAVSILDELKICYDKLIRGKNTDDSDADASEVLVELLLSFVSKPSVLFRKVSQHVFTAFMPEITAGGLKLITDVLESDESLRGQQELFDQEPEDIEDMEEDGDDDMDSDVEVTDMNADEGQFNGHLDDEDESSDDKEEDDDDAEGEVEEEENDAAKQLDDALAAALGTHRLDQDADADSDSDADMTDSEMMALDSKLIEIFSQRKKEPNKKQEQKDAKENMVNFKSRVLDLLETYVKKQATNPLAYGLLMPLLVLIRTTKTKQLADRAYGIISAFAKASKSTKETGSSNTSDLVKLLRAVHAEASNDMSHPFARAASSSSLLIASSLYRADKNNLEKVCKIYNDTLVRWARKEVKLQQVFFNDFVGWCGNHANSTV